MMPSFDQIGVGLDLLARITSEEVPLREEVP